MRPAAEASVEVRQMPQEGLGLEQPLESVGPGLLAAGYLGTGCEESG